MRRFVRPDPASLVGVPLTVAILVGAQWLEGGHLGTLLQPTAALVVFGGTLAALLVSYPMERLRRTMASVTRAFQSASLPTRAIVTLFTQYAIRARKRGVGALEPDIATAPDPFLGRALSLMVDGFSIEDVKHALDVDNQAHEEADEEVADVFESAAGYAPTLGILGAVLGLIQVMENLAAPSKLGAGIGVAFVATVYGVGSANLLFLPLATKLRTQARAAALGRELIIEGVGALQRGVHPRIVQQELSAYVNARQRERAEKAA